MTTQSGSYVGRLAEHVLLDRWFTEAAAGDPRLVIVSGEPGVGKTTLVRQWADRLDARVRVMFAHYHEDMSLLLLPLAGALDQLPGVADVVAAAARDADSEHAAVRSQLTVTRILLEAASRRPTVLVIDDAHWADQPTFELLQHLVAMMSHRPAGPPARCTIVLTVRPGVGSDRSVAALRRLAIEPIARPLALHGLDELDLHELLLGRLGGRPSASLVAAFHEATSGNPLLVTMVADQLQDRGYLTRQGGRLFATVPPGTLVVSPELEAAWSVRLEKVDRTVRSLLDVAAVLGDGSPLAELQAVADQPLESFDEHLRELEAAGLLDDDGDRYRFVHPMLRRALVAGLSGSRRRALERTVVEGLLLLHQDDIELVALRIIDHLRRAGAWDVPADVDRLLEVAARQATTVGAWGVAADCYQRMLDDRAGAPDDELGRLELCLGQAHRRNVDHVAAHPHLVAAVERSSRSGDLPTWGEALYWLTSAQVLERLPDVRVDPAVVDAFLGAGTEELPDARALVLANLAQFHFSQFDVVAARPALEAAKQEADHCARVGTRHLVATVEGLNRFGSLDVSGAQRCFRDALALSPDHEDPWQAVFIEVCLPLVDLLTGQLTRADREAAAATASAMATHQWHLFGLASACRAAAAIGQGRVDDAEREARTAVQSYRRSDYFWAAAVGYPHLAAARAYRGDVIGARQALADWADLGGVMVERHALRVELLCGGQSDIDACLATSLLASVPSEPSLFTLNHGIAAVEAGDRVQDLQLVEAGVGHLLAVPDAITYGIEWCSSIGRALALGELALGRFDEAATWLDRSEGAAATAESPLELARLAAVRARLVLSAGGTEAEAIRVLEPGLAFAEGHGLLAIVAEIRRCAPGAVLGLRRDVVVLYTDLVSSTELNVSAGDQLFLELLREHNAIVRRRLSAFSGVEFTFTGDGIGARFAQVDEALAFALGLQADFDDANREHPDFPMRVRIGLAVGDAMEDDGNLFGQTVVRAVRVCVQAEAGQVLTGEEVVTRADPTIARCASIGHFALKGFRGRSELFEACYPTASDYASAH